LILEEAGGIVTGFKGEAIDIFSNKILATNKNVHDQMVEVINKF
jgi:fructose-1,6-bisphosphatase/inositol monophosphatase family enzyme